MEAVAEPGRPQLRDVCLGEVLILVTKLGWRVNKLNIGCTSERRAHGIYQIEKASRGTRSDVEQPADGRVLSNQLTVAVQSFT
jgi:hypothetical protein